MKLPIRRSEPYVPRHSTRAPAPQRDVVIDLTTADAPARELLVSVLEGLRGEPAGPARQS